MEQTLTGTVQGSTIVLDARPAVEDGQAVEVVIRPKSVDSDAPAWGAGIARSAGGWAGHPELDAVMERIHLERKVDRPLPPLQ